MLAAAVQVRPASVVRNSRGVQVVVVPTTQKLLEESARTRRMLRTGISSVAQVRPLSVVRCRSAPPSAQLPGRARSPMVTLTTSSGNAGPATTAGGGVALATGVSLGLGEVGASPVDDGRTEAEGAVDDVELAALRGRRDR